MNAASSARIEQLLDRQIELARELADVLEAERDALTGSSPELVCEKAAAKVRLLERFEQLERQRRELCEQAGQAPGDAPRGFAQRWKSLMGLLAHCRNANETNGLILHLKQGQVRQLLDILRGGPAITYGPNGQTFAAAVRPLARV